VGLQVTKENQSINRMSAAGSAWQYQPSDIYTVSQKNIPDIFNCNLKTNYWILIIFGRNIPDTTCHQMTI